MNIRSFIGVACAVGAIASAMPAAVRDHGETVSPHFERAIPNIPGKSLVALIVDYTPGGRRLRTSTRNQRSSSPTFCLEKSSYR